MMRTVVHSTYEFDIGNNFKLVVNDDRSATWLRNLIEERDLLRALLVSVQADKFAMISMDSALADCIDAALRSNE